jgi:hypothetical protein
MGFKTSIKTTKNKQKNTPIITPIIHAHVISSLTMGSICQGNGVSFPKAILMANFITIFFILLFF